MGKDWYYWAGGRSSKRGGGEETAQNTTPTSGCMCAVFQIFDFRPFHFPTTTINNHHNHHQQNTLNKTSPSSIPQDIITKIPKGAEAPRNSLESEDGTASSVTREEDQHFKIPKNIEIKTSGRNLNDLSFSDSPAKTPTLVARLMGLDLLPGSNSPSSSSSSCISAPNPQNNVLPNLHHQNMMMRPRQQHMIQTKHRNSTDCVEFGATRRSDVVDIHHHRLSLQINKENIIGDDLEILPRFSFSKRKCDENNSSRNSSHLAKQIVKQVKESVVSRKVGQDITNNNIVKTRDQNNRAKELELVNNFKTKKSNSKASIDESSPAKQNSNTHSPRLRFIQTNKQNKPNTIPTPPKEQNTLQQPQPLVNSNTQQQQLPRVLTKPKPQPLLEQKELQNPERISLSVPKCKRVISNEKLSSRLKRPPPQTTTDIIRNKQEEPFIVRPTSPTRAINDMKNATKCKRAHPLSSNLLNNVPNLFPIRTEPSPPATKLNQKQVFDDDTQESNGSSQQLPSSSSHRYKQEGISTLATREQSSNNNDNNEDKDNDDAAFASTTGEFQCIRGILSRTTNKEEGTANTTTSTATSTSQRFSPLDPSIFDHLEEHPISNSHVSPPKNNKVCIFSMKNQLGRQRWNRRLMFDLVDEVLMEIFRPKSSEKKLWYLHGCVYQGTVEGLMERVWNRIGKFPCKKCEFLEDIDELIETDDMEKVKLESEEGLEEEGQVVVGEIEGNIWDTLLHESIMLMVMWGPLP